MPEPRFVTDDQVARLFDVELAISSQRTAFSALGSGQAQLAEKVMLPSPDGTVALCYLSRLSPSHGAVCKLASVYPDNPARGLPSIYASVLVLDPSSGRLIAGLDGATLTAVRTAAASAVAVDVLARPSASCLAVLGSGVQGREHVRAIRRVRPLTEVRMWSPTVAHRESAAASLAAEVGVPVLPVADPAVAVQDADIVVACTLSSTPVVPTGSLAAGATVISVGSFDTTRSEVDDALLRRAGAVVVDHIPTARKVAGPIVHALAAGILAPEKLRSLGEILTGATPGRTHPDELIFYNSVGLGIQDAAAAAAILDRLCSE
jgi:ornithine cyclodeaminase/alanine dehydrogenase-like protein (mu-crystallin family)